MYTPYTSGILKDMSFSNVPAVLSQAFKSVSAGPVLSYNISSSVTSLLISFPPHNAKLMPSSSFTVSIEEIISTYFNDLFICLFLY